MVESTVLSSIAEATRRRVAREKSEWKGGGNARASQPRDFAASFGGDGPHVIAEVKLASPSRGALGAGLDPVKVAREYLGNGATALSVLTEPTFFKGSVEHLRAIRPVAEVPLLMKDFFLDEFQLDQAFDAGADCILLIVALLGRRDFRQLLAGAGERGLSALVEVHDETEMEVALDEGASVIGVNNRNLRTLEVSLDVSRRLAPMVVGRDVLLICESGIRSHAEMVELAGLGYGGFLVGTTLIESGRPGAKLAELLGREAAA